MNDERCGTCKFYRLGKLEICSIWKGSICMNQYLDAYRQLREAGDKPETETCWQSEQGINNEE